MPPEVDELAGLELELWIGLFAPRGLPAAIAPRLETVSAKAIGAADFRARFAEQALVARFMADGDLRDYLIKEQDKYRSIIHESKITLR